MAQSIVEQGLLILNFQMNKPYNGSAIDYRLFNDSFVTIRLE